IEALDGFGLEFRTVARAGIRALYAEVKLPKSTAHRGLSEIYSIIDRSGLSRKHRDFSKSIFLKLARAEAKIHNVSVSGIELHEVGSLDAILDICGFVIAKDLLEIGEIYVAPPALGRGVSSGAHGKLPVPTPAVLELLAGHEAYGGSPEFEATTPTGAAILSTAAIFTDRMPQMTIEAVGYGAGSKDPREFPNVAQMVLGTMSQTAPVMPELPGHVEQVVELETNLDDITGELGGYLISYLLSKGALDVFLTSIIVKKDRPGLLLSAIVRPDEVARISSEIFALTGTLGIRSIAKERYVLERRFFEISLLGELVSVKAGPYRAKAEFSQLVALAEKHRVPILQLERMAQAEIEKYLSVNAINFNHQ
ncbi:MAG: nickel pincer cofactor biosynthesis protein LarC, partial [Acidimicrobiaceae bacterium]|nr:nickel pincer cofactor biosynthesis protein LarC [Acidimicrobiaceae bacterium]